MQIIEGTLTMTQAVDIIRKETGAHFVEPITERQRDETCTHFRVQHAVASEASPTVICFDRHGLDTYIERLNDQDGLRFALRTGVRGQTEETVRSYPIAALLTFKQPVDLIDFARDCLTLAAEGYEAMGETHIPQSLRQVLDRWPIAERKHPQPASQGNQNLPTSPSTEDIARRLYQVYSQHAGWKDYRGEPLPSFDDMREATKGHWLHVAEDLCIHGLGSNANALRIVETWPLSLLDGRRLAPVPLDGGVAPAKLKTSQEKPRPP